MACLTLFGCESETSPIEIAEIQLKQAESYKRSGQYRVAFLNAQKSLRNNPSNPDAHRLLASILMEFGQYSHALSVLDKAPEEGQDTKFIFTKAEAFIGAGKYSSAILLLNNSENVKSLTPQRYKLTLAEARLGLGRLTSAKNTYQEIIKDYPDNEEAIMGLTNVALQQNNLELATKLLSNLDSDLSTKNAAEIGILQAALAIKKNNLESAETFLSRSLIKLKTTDIITPQKAAVLSSLSEVLIKLGRTNEALIYTQLLADQFPGFETAQQAYTNAKNSFEKGNIDEAEKLLTEILEEHPTFNDASLLLAIIKFQKGEYSVSSKYFNQVIDPEINPIEVTKISILSNLRSDQPTQAMNTLEKIPTLYEDAKLLVIYGKAALRAKRPVIGIPALEKAIKLDPKLKPTYLILSDYYRSEEQNNYVKAIQYSEQAVSLFPTDEEVFTYYINLLIDAKEYKLAEQKVNERLIGRNPSATMLTVMGDVHLAEENFIKAIEYYEKALVKNRKHLPAAIKIFEVEKDLDADFETLVNALKVAISADPNNRDTYQTLLQLPGDTQEFSLVEKEVDAIALKEKNGTGLAVLLHTLLDKGNLNTAGKVLNKMSSYPVEKILEHKSYLRFHYLNAEKHLENGDIEPAKKSLFEGLKIAPKSLPLLIKLAEIEANQQSFNEAEKIARQIIQLDELTGRKLLGLIQKDQGQINLAIETYQLIWRIDHSDFIAYTLYSLLSEVDTIKAESFAKEWMIISDESILALNINAKNNMVQGRYNEAIPLFEKIKKYTPDNAINLNNLAWCYMKTNNEKALDNARQAYELSPDSAQIADTYGWILYKNGKKKQAVEILKKAVELDPEDQSIKEHLSEASQ